MKRLRVITNYLTRMRFCSPEGVLDLNNKSAPHAVTLGYAPWYALENRRSIGERIIFGHWAALEGQVAEADIFALDTGCVWGGCLSMLRLEDQALFQMDCKG